MDIVTYIVIMGIIYFCAGILAGVSIVHTMINAYRSAGMFDKITIKACILLFLAIILSIAFFFALLNDLTPYCILLLNIVTLCIIIYKIHSLMLTSKTIMESNQPSQF